MDKIVELIVVGWIMINVVVFAVTLSDHNYSTKPGILCGTTSWIMPGHKIACLGAKP